MIEFFRAFFYYTVSLWLVPITFANMIIPSSFSTAHKTSFLQENSPIESIIKVLSSYQIDSHIEVVLVGNTFESAMVGELSSSLKVLSDVAAAASPLKFVHEELVYHVSMGGGLEQKIRERIQNNPNSVSTDAIGEVLSEFHSHAATTTTLFVIHLGNVSSHTYSSKVANCPQRAFLAKKGFALLDLSARALILRSTDNGNDHIISETEFPLLNSASQHSGTKSMQTYIHDLASLIHRSGEAIVPFPIFSSDLALMGDASASTGRKKLNIIEAPIYETMPYVDEESPVQDETAIDIVVFTLCMAGGECEDDVDTKQAIKTLLVELSADVHNINLISYHLSADKDPHLSHAIHSATSYASPGSSDSVKGRYFMQHTEMKKRILPIFVLKLPDNLDAVVLDDGEQVVAHAFPEAAGGWLQEDEEASAIFSLHRQHVFESAWPSSAVIALRTSNNQPLPFIYSGLECGGIEIRKNNMDYMGELLDVIQSTIWGILPAHSHYSSSSRSLVQDYLWAGPSSIRQLLDLNDRTISGEHSFRERRQIPRHRIVHLSDQIIGKFVDVLIDAGTMRPAINITSLLGLKEHRPNLHSRTGFPSNPFTFQGKKEVKQVDVLKNIPAGKASEKSLFESFVSHLDLAAAAFSHLEYSTAQTHLNDASEAQIKLTKLVESMIQMRTGSYTCKDMRKGTRLQSLGQDASPESDVHVKGHFEMKHQESRGWTWFFGIIGSILMGCLVGYDVSTSKARRGME